MHLFSTILFFSISILASYCFNPGETKPFISRFSNTVPSSFVPYLWPKRTLSKFPSFHSQQPIKGYYMGPPTATQPKSKNKPSSANPMLKLTVHIPPATVLNYGKELNVKSGGEFTFTTPLENFHYASSGNVNLPCSQIRYEMRTSFSYPNGFTCFYLHFLSMKKKWDEGTGGLCYMVMNE